MADGSVAELGIAIENKVQGPQQLVETHIAQKDYLGQWGHDPDEWALNQISSQMPDGELKHAFDAGVTEFHERRIRHLMEWDPEIITDEAQKYAYRCVKRRSDNLPTWEHDESTLASLEDNIFVSGVDVPTEESATYISPGHFWNTHLFPGPIDFEKTDIDTSEILVYRNEPFVLPSKPGDKKTTLVKNRVSSQINIEEAQKYPTLRDIYIGRVEVRFDKNGIPFSEMFQWNT
jgi:hypothetical protein